MPRKAVGTPAFPLPRRVARPPSPHSVGRTAAAVVVDNEERFIRSADAVRDLHPAAGGALRIKLIERNRGPALGIESPDGPLLPRPQRRLGPPRPRLPPIVGPCRRAGAARGPGGKRPGSDFGQEPEAVCRAGARCGLWVGYFGRSHRMHFSSRCCALRTHRPARASRTAHRAEDWVALGRYRPRAPTDPYVLA